VWEIEFTDEFEAWWDGLEEGDQEKVRVAVDILEKDGPRWDVLWWTPSKDRGMPT
jgi:hypothetical protein